MTNMLWIYTSKNDNRNLNTKFDCINISVTDPLGNPHLIKMFEGNFSYFPSEDDSFQKLPLGEWLL